MPNPTPYRHSGKVGPAIIAVPFAAAAGAIFMASIYSAITVYVPIVGVVTIAALAAFGFALSMLASMLLRMAKSRNWILDYAVGLFTGVVALYASWVFFIFFLLDGVGIVGAMNPVIMFLVIVEIGQTGWYELKGSAPSGMFLYGIWAIEAAILVLAPLVLARASTDSPFCEKGGDWASEDQAVFLVGPNEGTDFAALVRDWQLDSILALAPYEQPGNKLILFTGAWCTCCEHPFTTVKVSTVVLTPNDKGEVDKRVTVIVRPHVIENEELTLLRDMVLEAAEQAEVEQAAVEQAEEAEPQDLG